MDAEEEIKQRVVEISKGDMLDLKANINSMILVLTDFLTLQTELMKKLVDKETLDEGDVQAIYATTGNKEIVSQAYTAVYNRYASYFEKAREVIREEVDKDEQQSVTLEGSAEIKSTATN